MNEPLIDLDHTHESQRHTAEDIVERFGADNFMDVLFMFMDFDPDECGEKFVKALNDNGIGITFDEDEE